MSLPATCPHVGIVILNWNRPDDTTAALKSLGQVDYPSFEVVVVDNGSRDDSPKLLRERFPGLALIDNGRNLGFAGGNNVGIRYLLERGAHYILLLNDDTEVSPDFLRLLVAEGERDARIGILGPKIYYYDPGNIIWFAGGAVSKFGQPSHPGADEIDDGKPESSRKVDYVTGCAILVKREVLERIGLLDERFFIYFEETEWCARARRAGFRVVYVPWARLWHKITPTARAHSRRYLYLMARNRLLYLRCTNAPLWIVVLVLVDLLRTALSWSIRPRYREMRPFATALTRGAGHFILGRFGAPPPNP